MNKNKYNEQFDYFDEMQTRKNIFMCFNSHSIKGRKSSSDS